MSKSLLFKFPEFSKGSDNISRKYFSLACVVIVFLKVKMNPSMVFFNWWKWWWERIGYFRNYFFKHYLNINLRIPTVPFQSWKNCWTLIDIGLLTLALVLNLSHHVCSHFSFPYTLAPRLEKWEVLKTHYKKDSQVTSNLVLVHIS